MITFALTDARAKSGLAIGMQMKIRTSLTCALLALLPAVNLSAASRSVSAVTAPIQASLDGHFLAEADGTPFFWLGDTAWELFYALTREETDRYLQNRARKGFTVINAVATGKLDRTGLSTPNRYGDPPFINNDPQRPNPHYFAHVDWVVNRAAQYGLRMAILPLWGSAFIGERAPGVFNATEAEEYGRWLGRRYRDRGVIWVLGGDINPIRAKKSGSSDDGAHAYSSTVDFRPVFDAMARGIEVGDGGAPFVTYHPSCCSPSAAAPPRMSLYFGDRDWLDLSMLQSSHVQASSGDYRGGGYVEGIGFVWNGFYNYVPVFDEYQAVPTRPVLDGEPRYEDHPIFINFKFEAAGFWRAHQVRGALYQALFAGAAGHTYGHFSVWDFYDPKRDRRSPPGYIDNLFGELMRDRSPWQQALDAPGAGQMRHAKTLLLSRPYFSRVPDQSLIVCESSEGEQHIGATRDRDGSYAMIYLPQGQPVTVDLSKLSGPHFVAWWLDPRTGKVTPTQGAVPTHQAHRFIPPTNGMDQDWVLVIDDASKNYRMPGI